MINMPTDRELTLAEFAASLRVSVETARDMLQRKIVPAWKVGRQWRVRESDVEAYKQRQREKQK